VRIRLPSGGLGIRSWNEDATILIEVMAEPVDIRGRLSNEGRSCTLLVSLLPKSLEGTEAQADHDREAFVADLGADLPLS